MRQVTTIRGVDGCPGGWLCAAIDVNGTVSAQIFPDAAQLFTRGEGAITAIDIPIGLRAIQGRTCDREARRLLGPRASSVFPAPARATLTAESYAAACTISVDACGKRLTQQTYAILAKIREVDLVLRQSPRVLALAWEVHPELSFYFWNESKPMCRPKKSGFGFLERYNLVREVFGDAAAKIRDAIPRDDAADDDILDALAALWTARRIHAGIAVQLPTVDEHDDLGLPMRMLA